MINNGKCPKCERIVTSVKIESITASTSLIGGRDFNAVSYCCKSCSTVLSVQMDPIALKSDTVAEIIDALRR